MSGCKSWCLILAVGAAAVAAVVAATPAPQPPAEPARELTPEEKAWMEASALNENHAFIAKFAGSWDFELQYWMSGQEGKSVGTCESTLILGGRFLHAVVKSEFSGMPFEGAMTWGYNNVDKRFESTWIDSMSTLMMVAHGKRADDPNTIISYAEFTDPMTGGKIRQREVVKWVSADRHTMEMFHTKSGAKEERVMFITYTRRNGGAVPATPIVDPTK